MSFKNWSKLFRDIDEKLQSHRLDDELRQNLQILSRGLVNIETTAKEENFNDLNVNGYWSFIRFCMKFCELIDNKLPKLKTHYDDLVAISRCVIGMYNAVEELRKKFAANKEPEVTLQGHERMYAYLLQFFTYTSTYQKELSKIHGKYTVFWLHAATRKEYKRMCLILALLEGSFLEKVRCLWNKDLRGSLVVRLTLRANKETPFPRINSLIKVSVPFFRTLYHIRGVKGSSINIRSLSPFVFLGNDHKIAKVKHRETEISCRWIRKSASVSTNLIYHCHGGGFLIGSPGRDESLYLRKWCSELDCSILAVDYRLLAPFPTALQDVLDVYFWLIEDSNVASVLGFKPKKIYLSGDSAGANLVVALTLALNDIKATYGLNELVMPNGIISFYGYFCPLSLTSPSRALFFVDSALSSPFVLVSSSQYAGLGSEDTTDNRSDSELPWYVQNQQNSLKFTKMVSERLNSPYAVPLIYRSFDQIKIPLHVMTTHFCPLVDDSVALAKKWKGPIAFHFFDDVGHAFLNYGLKNIPDKTDRLLTIMREILKT